MIHCLVSEVKAFFKINNPAGRLETSNNLTQGVQPFFQTMVSAAPVSGYRTCLGAFEGLRAKVGGFAKDADASA